MPIFVVQESGSIEEAELTLDEWLGFMLSPERENCFPNDMFPTDDMRNEYLDSIKFRDESEVIDLLRCFLIPTSWAGDDRINWITSMNKNDPDRFREAVERSEFIRRILRDEPAWEGITWIIDLLYRSPNKAMTVLWAYFEAQPGHFSDRQIWGHGDALSLIRAKFVDMSHPQKVFLELSPRQFEVLIRNLYREMGYEAQLTPPGNDGGRDIVAEQRTKGQQEKIFIECKRWEKNVGRPVLNKLFGVVQAEHYSRGVIVCCSDFSRPAKEFASKLSSIELIDLNSLCELLNQHLGPRWKVKLDRYLRE